MRMIALIAALSATPLLAQDAAIDAMPVAWDTIETAMTTEVPPIAIDKVENVTMIRYELDAPGTDPSRNRIVCSAVTPALPPPPSDLIATVLYEKADRIAGTLGLAEVPRNGLTECNAFLGIGTADRAAFIEACVTLLEDRGLRASPYAESGSYAGAAGPADMPVGDTILLRAACSRSPAGDTSLSLHFGGLPPMPK